MSIIRHYVNITANHTRRFTTSKYPFSRCSKVLYEIASSHLAKRTFAGNLYKHVKGQDLVGALSGHKEGNRAFARYREVDEETNKS